MENIWLMLHNTITRNYSYSTLDELLQSAENFLEEEQPLRLSLPNIYELFLASLEIDSVQLSYVPI